MNSILTVIILILLFFQTAFDAVLPSLVFAPPLFFVVVAVMFWINQDKAELVSFAVIMISGLLYDVLRASTFGQSSLTMIVSLLGARLVALRMSRKPRTQGFALVVLAVIFFGLLDYVLSSQT